MGESHKRFFGRGRSGHSSTSDILARTAALAGLDVKANTGWRLRRQCDQSVRFGEKCTRSSHGTQPAGCVRAGAPALATAAADGKC